MKIVQRCDYIGPATNSMGAERMIESLSTGLVEAGHDVFMWLNPATQTSPVRGATLVSEPPDDADIIHFHGWIPSEDYDKFGKPWVATIHGGGSENDPVWLEKSNNNPHIICVSKFIADRINCSAYAWACSNPDEFIFSEQKNDYFLWMAGTDWGEGKGLFTTLNIAKKLKIKLKVAGIGKNQQIIEAIKSFCDDKIEYIGAINGQHKAEVLSKAKGYILYTRLPDACPRTVSEALLSGTPIISSTNGAMPEILNEKVGFLCKDEQEIIKAIAKIKTINSKHCYEYGLKYFSHSVCAKKHIEFYLNMIENRKVN